MFKDFEKEKPTIGRPVVVKSERYKDKIALVRYFRDSRWKFAQPDFYWEYVRPAKFGNAFVESGYGSEALDVFKHWYYYDEFVKIFPRIVYSNSYCGYWDIPEIEDQKIENETHNLEHGITNVGQRSMKYLDIED